MAARAEAEGGCEAMTWVEAKCTRCDKERETIAMYAVRPGSHSIPLAVPDLPRASKPEMERVCGDCLSDLEIRNMLAPVVEDVLSGLIRDTARELGSARTIKAIETVHAQFRVMNYATNNRRYATLRALGLSEKKR